MKQVKVHLGSPKVSTHEMVNLFFILLHKWILEEVSIYFIYLHFYMQTLVYQFLWLQVSIWNKR